MSDPFETYFPIFFPIIFVFGWLFVSVSLGWLSGWYRLMRKYPDKTEAPLLQLKNQSGMMGIISMSRIIKIAVCPSGLRIGIMKIFGPFCRDFFVPWQEIKVIRKDRFFWQAAELHFGDCGRLSISSYIADRLARSTQGHWPESAPFPEETNWQAFAGVAKQWFLFTTVAASFFIIVPRVTLPAGTSDNAYPPIDIAILFPAIFVGIVCLIQYFQRINRK